MTEHTEQPTVYLVIDGSAIGRDGRGEIIETVDWHDDGKPDWTDGSICDHRGGGGDEGYRLLGVALDAAEENARLVGYDHVKPVPEPR